MVASTSIMVIEFKHRSEATVEHLSNIAGLNSWAIWLPDDVALFLQQARRSELHFTRDRRCLDHYSGWSHCC